jgi:hypothetical protein
MKKVLFIFTLLAFAGMDVYSQTPYWNTAGNGSNTDSEFIGTTDDQPLIFRTGNRERMRLLPSQSFLGIGTDIPLATLHLHYQQGSIPIISQKLLQLTTPANTIGFSIFSDFNTNDITFKQQEAANFSIEGVGGGFVIDPTGKIGFGTETPDEKVHVEGNLLISSASGSSQGALIFDNGTGNLCPKGKFVVEYQNSGGYEGLNFRKSCFTLQEQPSTASYLFISNSGNISIGGSRDPQAMLDVLGSFNAASANIADDLTAKSLNAQSATLSGYLNATVVNVWNMLDANTVDANTVVVRNEFKAPKAKINGLLCAKEVRVMNFGSPCWPDYVFSKNYHLMPLQEVEQFIAENQHLPNVPSAADVEVNGIELGEMNAILLQKVEELTLYIIDLQKQMNELKTGKP